MAVITKRKNNFKSKSSMKTKRSSKSKSNSKTRKQFKNIRKNGMGTRKMIGGVLKGSKKYKPLKQVPLKNVGMTRLKNGPQIPWVKEESGKENEFISKNQANPLKKTTTSIEVPQVLDHTRSQTPKEKIDVKTQIINGLTTKINYLTKEKNKLPVYNLLGKKRLRKEINSLTKNQQEQLRVKTLLKLMELGGN